MYGEPETFRELANRLDGRRPVYGIHHAGSLQECEPVKSIAKLAQLYAADIRTVQTTGPYYLLGYSLGGAIAFETARELAALGEKIGLVIMAESLAPGYPTPPPRLRRYKIHIQNMVSGTLDSRKAYLRERLRNVRTRIIRKLGLGALDAPDEPIPEHIQQVNDAMFEAYGEYVVRPQNIDVMFLTSENPFDWPGAVFDDPLCGWGPSIGGRIMQRDIPGDHRSLFKPQNIEHTSACVREGLAAADPH
ncbi:MAG: thioesterase domain-containing protein [Polyangiales bacterium]